VYRCVAKMGCRAVIFNMGMVVSHLTLDINDFVVGRQGLRTYNFKKERIFDS
jgi:hypothetical protein